MIGLKPCPFCGHEPRIDGNTIVCGYCGAHMHAFDSSIDWLVKNWNCRAEVKGDADENRRNR